MERQYPEGFIKFDQNGNLYTLELGKDQFSIKRISWDQDKLVEIAKGCCSTMSKTI